MKKITLLVLIVALLFTGCVYIGDWFLYPSYSEMEYTRPDTSAFEALLESCCQGVENAKTTDEALTHVYAYYDAYDDFFTNYNLSYIRFCGDTTDLYWEKEYNFCAENISVPDRGLETLYRTIAGSSLRADLEEVYFGEDFFLAYDGEAMWDDTFTAMMQQESALLEQYYAICSKSADFPTETEFYDLYATELLDIYRQLVLLRQEIAAYTGYDSFPEFAYAYNYSRDYTPDQITAYYDRLQQCLVPLYTQLDASHWEAASKACSPAEALAYTQSAARAMGGVISDAFSLLKYRGLYDNTYSDKKHNISFEVYLSTYQTPFIFMSPSGTDSDKMTLTHEFGHFVNDYLCGGSYAGTDVAEIHSQAMEYLSLCYVENETLEDYKMADCLAIFVEQAALGLFEHTIYAMSEVELTTEAILATYAQIGEDFGFTTWQWEPRDLVLMTHFYEYPMYVDSYVVSNDVAFQIYQLELENAGAGLDIYMQCLESEESWLITFTETYGLESPFTEGRLPEIAETLKQALSLDFAMQEAA